MKKALLLLFFLCMLCLSGNLANAETMRDKIAAAQYDGPTKRVAILLDAPITYVNNETIIEAVNTKSKNIFKAPHFKIIPTDEVQTAAKIYREEHNLVSTPYYNQSFKMADVQALGKDLKSDYVFLLMVNNSAPRVGAGLFSVSFKTTITCDARLMDVETGKYIYTKTYTKDGSSTGVLGGMPSFDNAYKEALTKILESITLDTNKL